MNLTTYYRISALLCVTILPVACDSGPAKPVENDTIRVLESPARADSQAPNLAVGSDGSVVMSWIEADGDQHALRYTRFADGAWDDVKTVATGRDWFVNWADFPSVVPISGDLWAAHWLVRRDAGGYAYDIHAAISTDGGDHWSEPFVPHTDDTDTEHGFVTLFPSGSDIGMLWLDGRKMVNEFDENNVGDSGMTLRGAIFNAEQQARREFLVDDLICDCCQTDVTVTGEGPVAVYRNRTTAEIRDIYLTRPIDGQWRAGKAVGSDNWEIPGCPVNGPVIQSQGRELALAWFAAPNGEPRVQAAWSNDAGRTVSDPVRVATGALLGHVGATMLPDGDLAVTWLSSATGGSAELHIRRVSADGHIGPEQNIAAASGVAPFSVPQIVRADGALLIAWTDSSGDDPRVRTALVPLAYLD